MRRRRRTRRTPRSTSVPVRSTECVGVASSTGSSKTLAAPEGPRSPTRRAGERSLPWRRAQSLGRPALRGKRMRPGDRVQEGVHGRVDRRTRRAPPRGAARRARRSRPRAHRGACGVPRRRDRGDAGRIRTSRSIGRWPTSPRASASSSTSPRSTSSKRARRSGPLADHRSSSTGRSATTLPSRRPASKRYRSATSRTRPWRTCCRRSSVSCCSWCRCCRVVVRPSSSR